MDSPRSSQVSLVLRVLRSAAGEGAIVGSMEVVWSGRRVAVRDADELVAAVLAAAAREPVGPPRRSVSPPT